MRKLTGSDTGLRWIQPRFGNRLFELKSDVYVVATLWWEKTFGTLAKAEAGDMKWTFKRVGIFNTRVIIRSPWSDMDVGVFKRSWSYAGTLDLQGRTYAWKHMGFLNRNWGFARPDGTMLVTFRYSGGLSNLFRRNGEVEVAPGAASDPDLPLLLTLGWYLMVMMADNMASAAANAAV